MRVLFATAELSPVARVGGLAEASAGLVRALRSHGLEVDVVLPDYQSLPLARETEESLDVPAWAGHVRARRGTLDGVGEITLISADALARPHPYVDPISGEGWPDNTARFFAFSAAVTALARRRKPDLLHLNDWHTAAALGMVEREIPSLLTIHTLAYQGQTDAAWLRMLPRNTDAYALWDGCNPLAGAIALAGAVVTVSPTYAREILVPPNGFGLEPRLAALGDRLVGIRNGIDLATWQPATDEYIEAEYDADDLEGKRDCRHALRAELGWEGGGPIIGMVTRLTEQKGIDVALETARYLPGLRARLVILGAGDPALAREAAALAIAHPDRVSFHEGYDDALGHRIFAGSDLFLMPSRFEPCGLAQMQAMEYGTIPVVTDVGGLHDTVTDADSDPEAGTGFVSETVDAVGLLDALHRAVRAWRNKPRRRVIQHQGMSADWSWEAPAATYQALYKRLAD